MKLAIALIAILVAALVAGTIDYSTALQRANEAMRLPRTGSCDIVEGQVVVGYFEEGRVVCATVTGPKGRETDHVQPIIVGDTR